jgi:hypothetical protein
MALNTDTVYDVFDRKICSNNWIVEFYIFTIDSFYNKIQKINKWKIFLQKILTK